ncbi:MAG TPA: FIST C-terminal domain-containing protein, partial [Polyangium sp.]|nr:FIST C-terminal domain-containing protein [Polyangium sp.]
RRAIVFGGDLPEGAEIRMTTATKTDVISGADDASARALTNLPRASIALVFDCMARKVLLGPRYREELNRTFEQLGDIPRIGFYTYGELSPVQGVTMHHDETFTIALIGA